jgi:S-DNA-T family DNA segregation ATPase FtsK/SpoIIIE
LARGKTTEEGSSKAWSEVLGLVLLGTGTLLFLALVSYSPADVPSWVFFSKQGAPSEITENFIGPVGAIVAGFCYFLLGAASYLLAVVLIGFGGAKFLSAGLDLKKRAGWMAAFVVSGACLAGIQPWFLQSWKEHFNILGPGGWLGLALGKTVLAGLLGAVGATILLVLLYLASLILMTGMHPVKFFRAVMVEVPAWWRARREAQLEKKRLEQEAAVEEALATTPRSKRTTPARPRRKATADEDESEEEEIEEEELLPPTPLPEPKIIDTGAVTPPAKKPLPPAPPPKKKKEPGALGAVPDIHIENYQMPPLDLLDSPDTGGRQSADPNELLAVQNSILDTLKQFGLEASPGDITRGPTVTRFEVYPARGVRVDRIVSLEKDIARATRAEKINILAPIPGKDTVGIEIANSKKIKVVFRELLESDEWVNSKAKIPLALGKDVYGRTIIADLAQMPHLLIAGTTGSGKSVCVNAIIASMLYKFSPEELRFIMIDPKVVEMQHYGKLPHLAANVVTEPKKVLLALRYVIDEMERRYRIFAKCGLRNIHGFNTRPLDKKAAEAPPPEPEPEENEGEEEGIDDAVLEAVKPKKGEELVIPDKLPYIVVIIDELADLMQTAPADVESAIARITQMARAAGIHMIVATQTPRADVVTGVIKANIPSRIAFQVASKLDSRVILDANGAEKLLGQGDMLYLPPGTSTLVRAQGVLVTDEEIHRVVDYVGAQAEPAFDPGFHEAMTSPGGGDDDVSEEDEELVTKCLEIIKQEGKASTSMLQRRLRLGYTRAARVVDILEQRGIVGPKDGAKDREILVDLDSLPG